MPLTLVLRKEILLAGLLFLSPSGSVPMANASDPSRTASETSSGEVKAKVVVGKAGIEWVTIPAGSFMFGADYDDNDDGPARRITMQEFQLARTPVTFAQYGKCVEAGACTPAHVSDGKCEAWNGSKWILDKLPESFQGADQPVVCVDWEQAKVFSKWVGGRLPSEAEWVYAARNAGGPPPWGDKETDTCDLTIVPHPVPAIWYYEEETRALIDKGSGCGRNSTWPVCSRPAGNTRQGLCDMMGNVLNWVQDSMFSYRGAPTDGSAWEHPKGVGRIYSGGSWFRGNHFEEHTLFHQDPLSRENDLGFRPARSLESPARPGKF